MSTHINQINSLTRSQLLLAIQANVATLCHTYGVHGTFTVEVPATNVIVHNVENEIKENA